MLINHTLASKKLLSIEAKVKRNIMRTKLITHLPPLFPRYVDRYQSRVESWEIYNELLPDELRFKRIVNTDNHEIIESDEVICTESEEDDYNRNYGSDSSENAGDED